MENTLVISQRKGLSLYQVYVLLAFHLLIYLPELSCSMSFAICCDFVLILNGLDLTVEMSPVRRPTIITNS